MKNQDDRNKRFFTSSVATFWILKSALGGIIYATAAFFTKQGWERWNTTKLFDIDRFRINK
jgi:hypothetical protein